jgi:outer membrane protein TolC
MDRAAYHRLSANKVLAKACPVSWFNHSGFPEPSLLAATHFTRRHEKSARSKRRLAALAMQIACAALMGACATYRPLPLPETIESAQSVAELRGGQDVRLPLDMAAVERLVLLNNPDLHTARAQRDVAQAQMLQAGLLPNPSLNGSIGYLISGVGDATAWTAGISEDIQSLITLGPRRQGAKAAAAHVDASLLWQEWQTIGKARLLVVDLVEGERLRALQQPNVDLLEERSAQLKQSMAEGNMDMSTASPFFLATVEARASLDDLQRRLLSQRHDLAALLGLPPDADIPLQPDIEIATADAAAIRDSAASIQRRRPDLVALQLGYQSQEATLRAAVLAQFPRLSFGYDMSQDNSRVRNGGPAITLDLPLFDRNQGNIAIAKATRGQLRAEYTVRLNAAHHDIDAALGEQLQLQEQLATLQSRLPETMRSANDAAAAWKHGLIDIRSYVDLMSAAQSQQSTAVSLEQAMVEQQVALDSLLGTGMPNSLSQDVIAP